MLAFDDTMVATAIGAKYGSGPELGRQFLEKIVQYPFTLPAVGRERLASFVCRRRERACIDAGVELDAQDWAATRRVVEDCLLRRLTTPRQAIRYVNALEFALPMLKGMVKSVRADDRRGLARPISRTLRDATRRHPPVLDAEREPRRSSTSIRRSSGSIAGE